MCCVFSSPTPKLNKKESFTWQLYDRKWQRQRRLIEETHQVKEASENEEEEKHFWPKTKGPTKCAKDKDAMIPLAAVCTRTTPDNLRTAEYFPHFRCACKSPSKFTANLCKSFKYCLSIKRYN